ncbi:MAG: ZIP family metal transporter [candidate division Zixibacteria bacterium]|nr:ZIP family metal transporter [candidate division Zixibacteria bacterium]
MDASTVIFLLIAALSNLAGAGFFLWKRRWEDEPFRLLLGTAAGFMLAVAFVELAPEAAVHTPNASLWLLGGFLLIHLFEHVLTPHFHYGHETHTGLGARVGLAAMLGLGLHSLVDGVAIVVASQVGARVGAMVFIAMVWHKIPDGFTAASVVAATGGTRRRALGAGAILAVASLVGGLAYAALPTRLWLGPALGLSAGSLTYVAATDLLPEVNRRRSVLAPAGVMIGMAVFYLVHWAIID